MTKKHFEAIARIIHAQQAEDGADRDTIKSTAIRLAAEFTRQNERFNPVQFLTACGF